MEGKTMLRKALATAAAIVITTLPAMADNRIQRFPNHFGQIPCSEVRVEVAFFDQTRKLDFTGRSVVELSNDNAEGTYIQVGAYRFSALTVRVENGRLICIGVPLAR